jgi:hypothetical protein
MIDRRFLHVTAVAAAFLSIAALLGRAADMPSAADVEIAQNLATMLQSARAVISEHQQEINDPGIGDKGLTGEKVVAEAIANFRKKAGKDPRAIDQASFEGRMLKAQLDSVLEVMDANQALINKQGVGFKGFIPATFARLVNEAFVRRVGKEATIKVTAPPDLVRNRRTRPDAWEVAAIKDYLDKADWPKGKVYSAIDTENGTLQVRVVVPEYYQQSCMSCHGEPKGELDITGYPKEGGHIGQLGGVISIGLVQQ